MSKSIKILTAIFGAVLLIHCGISTERNAPVTVYANPEELVRPAIYDFPSVLDAISRRSTGVVTNHTGMIGNVHLIDTLLNAQVKVMRVFAPEHGFRGDVPDGEEISDGRDPKTGLEIVSLYGANKKPTKEQLDGIQVMVFDIQDVGARFYTYLSTLHYVMQTCAESGIPVIVLDRPNPNIHRVDGPILEPEFRSFVGMHPVPVVYGMTIGEYALMINGEGWLDSGKCDLVVLPCLDYKRSDRYALPHKPSPNLPNMEAIYLYPSLCFFEGTNVSVGRGTEFPFTVIGEPGNTKGDYSFTPVSTPGASLHPKHEGVTCVGYDISDHIDSPGQGEHLDITWLKRMYEESPDQDEFFNSNGYFDKLAGSDELRKSIIRGDSPQEIRNSWKPELENFETIRRKYLIYSK